MNDTAELQLPKADVVSDFKAPSQPGKRSRWDDPNHA